MMMKRCFWALTLLNLIGITTHAAFIPVLQCPDVDFEQASGFKCSNSSFKLHCILEKDACQPGLVCLPWSWMRTNICPIYSMSTVGIHYSPCIGDNTQCPHNVTLYKSFEAYKYPGCFVCKNKLPTTTTVETKSDTTTETKILIGLLTEAPPVTTSLDCMQTLENNRSSEFPIYGYIVIFLLIIVVTLIISIVRCRKLISRKSKGLIYCNNTEMKNSYGGQISGQNEENSQTRLCCIKREDPEMKSTIEWNEPESENNDDCRLPEEEIMVDSRSPDEELMVDFRSPEEAPIVDSGFAEGAILIDLQTECSADQNEEGKDIERIKGENKVEKVDLLYNL